MKRITPFCSSLLFVFILEGWATPLLAQEPILETYSIHQGGNQTTKPSELWRFSARDWLQEFEDLPLTAQQINITFFGNYE